MFYTLSFVKRYVINFDSLIYFFADDVTKSVGLQADRDGNRTRDLFRLLYLVTITKKIGCTFCQNAFRLEIV